MIKAIWCQTKDGGIGYEGKLPWYLPEEIRLFRSKTIDGVVIMGYKTFESLGFEPLPFRDNYVLTTKDASEFSDHNIRIFSKPEDVLHELSVTNKDVWVIGGNETFKAFLPYITEFHISVTKDDFPCTTFIDFIVDNVDLVHSTEYDKFFHHTYRG